MTPPPNPKLAALASQINGVLESVLGADSELLGEIGFYSFLAGGKRLRPLVFLLVAESLGLEINPQTVKTSAVFEFLHMATLLHDDIVDQADSRRGQMAAHHKFGIPETVLAGDYLLSKAATIAMDSGDIDFLGLLIVSLRELALGELYQLRARRVSRLTLAEYLDIIGRKTAALFRATALAAATLAKADSPAKEAIALYGERYGLSFQILDDILDYESSPEALGKPVLKDLTEGRITIPFILARDALPAPKSQRLAFLGARLSLSPAEKEEVFSLIRAGDGVARAADKALEFARAAREALHALPPSEARETLQELALANVGRQN
ncbi:MAG: polyprenyl synthetase family protein [Deltaproteobacteria bacterium]|jgi:octaprenyl-diphosphate synthase|nr:polyprenyl synthetase family protein [Deltaproteobacteria bacterium]